MILVLGVGVVGKAVLEYFKNEEVCFYDDQIKSLPNVPFFSSWDNIELVVVSPGVELRHDFIQEATRRNIKITNDIAIFLENNPDGIKIGITGTNGKSTTCAVLAQAIGKQAVIGGNYGISPLQLPKAEYYILELSSYQLELLSPETLAQLDIGIITNIYPSHLDRHGGFEDYISAKCKILSAKKRILGFCELFDSWKLEKTQMSKVFPANKLFEKEEYKFCWSIIENVLNLLNIDKEQAMKRVETYQTLPFRQEIICTNPIKIINDSKSTNPIATKCSALNMAESFCLLVGGKGEFDWSFLSQIKNKIIKVFVYGKTKTLREELKKNEINYQEAEIFEEVAKEAIKFALKNKTDLLFSPGHQSFDSFKNFGDRGNFFNDLVQTLI